MKAYREEQLSAVGRLIHWCEVPSPPFSLAVGATCGCDISCIEREVCRCVNEAALHPAEEFGSFDCEDIRHLAGDPVARRFILDRAGMGGREYDRWSDYALVLRGLASMGGVILCGQGAIDATRGLKNVCEVMIARCDRCDDAGITSWIDPDFYDSETLEKTVAGHFLEWLSNPDRVRASKRKAMGIPESLVAV